MSLRPTVDDFVPNIETEANATFHECRRCGTTLDERRDDCPECGSREISHLEITCDCASPKFLVHAGAWLAVLQVGAAS